MSTASFSNGTGSANGWNWRTAARCRIENADELFVRGALQREARAFCKPCPVRTECLAHALDERVEFGVWGGMTERERRALLKARPDVMSWAELLSAARSAHYATAGQETAGTPVVALPMPVVRPAPAQRAA